MKETHLLGTAVASLTTLRKEALEFCYAQLFEVVSRDAENQNDKACKCDKR